MTGPIYKLVATNLGGEKRFAAAVARRLQSLGALTRGDRRAASGIDLSESNFDSPLGRKSLRSACLLPVNILQSMECFKDSLNRQHKVYLLVRNNNGSLYI